MFQEIKDLSYLKQESEFIFKASSRPVIHGEILVYIRKRI